MAAPTKDSEVTIKASLMESVLNTLATDAEKQNMGRGYKWLKNEYDSLLHFSVDQLPYKRPGDKDKINETIFKLIDEVSVFKLELERHALEHTQKVHPEVASTMGGAPRKKVLLLQGEITIPGHNLPDEKRPGTLDGDDMLRAQYHSCLDSEFGNESVGFETFMAVFEDLRGEGRVQDIARVGVKYRTLIMINQCVSGVAFG